MYNDNFVSAIIAAAGSSKRMGGINKIFMNLGGEPVLARTVRVFEFCPLIDEIIIVCKKGDEELCVKDIVEPYSFKKVKAVVSGGEERYDSVMAALGKADQRADLILVHDGARPFVSEDIIRRVCEGAETSGAAVPAIPVKDTIKKVKSSGNQDDIDKETLFTDETPDRSELYAVQTPQGFRAPIIKKAYDVYPSIYGTFHGVTDDSSIIEALGHDVRIVEGHEDNGKITNAADIGFAEYMVGRNEMSDRIQRTGIGYDVHAFAPDRRLILGGVCIPYEMGLLGHSDADVLVHAVMDALFGAAALGDIGKHFPDSDEKYKGISSLELLFETGELLNKNGFAVSNIDATVVAQAPKISPYIEEMKINISSALKISVNQINIKGTTTEGLGFAGRKEGISAYASALVWKQI